LVFAYSKFEIKHLKSIFKDLTFLSASINIRHSFHFIFTIYNFEDF